MITLIGMILGALIGYGLHLASDKELNISTRIFGAILCIISLIAAIIILIDLHKTTIS